MMKKNMSIWIACGVLVSCSNPKPAPDAQPTDSRSASGVESTDIPDKIEPRTDLDTSRLVIAPQLDPQQVLQTLTVQREIARDYAVRKTKCEALEANDSDECGKHAECTSRIEPACAMCDGGRLVCIARDSGEESHAHYKEQEMLECLGMSDTTWHIYTSEPPATTDRMYQQCICDDFGLSSIDAFVERGYARPDAEAGTCVDEKTFCTQQGGTFQKARLLEKVSPEDYETYKLTVRPNARFQRCNISMSRPSQAAEDDTFVGLLENGACVVYRMKGYEVTRTAQLEDDYPEQLTSYLPHRCETP